MKKKIVGPAGLCASVLAVSLPVSTPLYAQSAEPAKAGVSSLALEEVIVTARKREERLQDVPASVQVFSQQQIEALDATSLYDLNGTTPNVKMGADGTLTIRGITSSARNVGFEAGAAVYIDGVFQGRPLGNNQDLVDVSRVEFLRGPQGTLYGKNTTAGAVSVTTVRPGDTLEGKLTVRLGERNDEQFSGYVAGPLVADVLGGKLALFSRKSDGYQKNIVSGVRSANADAYGGRTELSLNAGAWDLALRGDYSEDKYTPYLRKAVVGFAVIPGDDVIASNINQKQKIVAGGVSLTAERDIGDYGFTSITAWRKVDAYQLADHDFSVLDGAYSVFSDKADQYSQEIRLASPAEDRFRYVVGAYYFQQQLNSYRPVVLGSDFPVQGTLNDIVETNTDSYALFGSADYDLTDKLTLIGGLRYTYEEKTLDFVQEELLVLGYPAFDIEDKFDDNDLSPTVNLRYNFTPEIMAYIGYGKGFKSGGWNPDITTTSEIKFDSENVTSYEVGLRTQFFDQRLTVNATVYHMDYSDLQVSQFIGTFSGYVITNAGQAEIDGLELEILAQPTSWLKIATGGAYNDAKYTRYDTGTGVDFSGQQFSNVPKYSAYISSDVSLPISGPWSWFLHADYRYQSEIYFDDLRRVTPAGPAAEDSYAMLNANIGVMWGDSLEISAYAQNLTDERVLNSRGPDDLGLGLTLESWGSPRQFGVRVDYSL